MHDQQSNCPATKKARAPRVATACAPHKRCQSSCNLAQSLAAEPLSPLLPQQELLPTEFREIWSASELVSDDEVGEIWSRLPQVGLDVDTESKALALETPTFVAFASRGAAEWLLSAYAAFLQEVTRE